MNILVCSNGVMAESTFPVWKELCEHNIHIISPQQFLHTTPDAIVSMSISVMPETEIFVSRYPDVPLYCYNWDCYEWIWDHPRGRDYDWDRYGDLLSKATEVWVPSRGTVERTKQWWNIDNRKVIQSGCPSWDYPVEDKEYALCCLREIPDPFWGRFEQACKELQIPYVMTNHKCTLQAYEKTVAECRFLCSPLYELSTGGLSLREGYRLGKPCLISEYLQDRATYFEHNHWDHFKKMLYSMYYHTPSVRLDHRDWVNKNFSYKRMLDDMLERINVHQLA